MGGRYGSVPTERTFWSGHSPTSHDHGGGDALEAPPTEAPESFEKMEFLYSLIHTFCTEMEYGIHKMFDDNGEVKARRRTSPVLQKEELSSSQLSSPSSCHSSATGEEEAQLSPRTETMKQQQLECK